jgi:PKD repeat protein
VNPIHTYSHFPNGEDEPRVPTSITGGVFYTGNDFPTTYQGKYFFADYQHEFIKVLDPATNAVSNFFTDPGGEGLLEVLDMDVAPDGQLWTLSLDGTIHRYRYVGSGNRAPVARASANVTSGTTPLVVNFSGAASTDPDGDSLTYTWDFGDGTTGSGRNVTKTYATAGTFAAKLTVSDGRGASAVSEAITIIPGSTAPLGTITAPVVGQTFRAGMRISFSGTATDPEDGVLPASAYEWKVVFHHADHFHPFINSIPGVTSGSFVIPRVGEQAPDQWYRVHLTVTDSHGVQHTSFTDVLPQLTTIQLATNVPGVNVTLDGSPQEAPGEVQGVEGMLRTLGVTPVQTVGSKTYRFTGWSDGGAETHDIVIPRNFTTYVANFAQIGGPVDAIVPARADAFVRDGAAADLNFGLDTAMVVKRSSNTGNTREGHVKFDITGVPVGAGQRVKLRMWAQLSDGVNNNLQVGVYPVADATWGERWITWNTRPASGSSALATQTISGTGLRMYEWDVTDYVAAEKAAGRDGIAFALKRANTSATQVWLYSGEAAAYGPSLVIEPPTTTIATETAAYVRGGSFADVNFGNDPELLTKISADQNLNRVSYLKFDISAVPATVTSAGLRLFGALDSFDAAGVPVGVYSSTNHDWSESGLRYNNGPRPGAAPLATVTVAGTTTRWYEWDLTAFIQAEKAAGRNTVTLAIITTAVSDPFVTFNSDDAGSNVPRLVVT